MLRPAHDNGVGSRPPIIVIDGEEEFELQTILQHSPGKSKGDSNMKFLVSWKGYDPIYNSWEPEVALKRHAAEALNEYWDEVAAVQAAQAEQPDTGLAPGELTDLPTTHYGNGRDRGRTGQGRGRGRTSLRPEQKGSRNSPDKFA